MEISEIPVTDSRGRVIGKAKLEKDSTGIRAHMVLEPDVGRMLMYGMRDDMIRGLSLLPVIEPAIKAPSARQYQTPIDINRYGVGYIPPGMQQDWPVIGKARIEVDENGALAHFEFTADPPQKED